MSVNECCVFIHLNYETVFGERVYLVGNHPQLGEWDIERALEFNTDETLYPLWVTHSKLTLPDNYTLEFKLLIANDHSIRWEDFPNNRTYSCHYRKAVIAIRQHSQQVAEKQV